MDSGVIGIMLLVAIAAVSSAGFAHADDLMTASECVESTHKMSVATAQGEPVPGVSVDTITGLRETSVETKFTTDKDGIVEIPFYDNTGFVWIHKGGFNDRKTAIEECVLPQNSHSQTNPAVPDWIRQVAKLWSNDQISDAEYLAGIRYLIMEGIIRIPGNSIESIFSAMDAAEYSMHAASESGLLVFNASKGSYVPATGYGLFSCEGYPIKDSGDRFFSNESNEIQVKILRFNSAGHADVCYAAWQDYMDSLHLNLNRAAEYLVWHGEWNGYYASTHAWSAESLRHSSEMWSPDISQADDCTGIDARPGGVDLACVKGSYAIIMGSASSIDEELLGLIIDRM